MGIFFLHFILRNILFFVTLYFSIFIILFLFARSAIYSLQFCEPSFQAAGDSYVAVQASLGNGKENRGEKTKILV